MKDPLRIDLVEIRRKLASRRSFQREATMEGLVVGSTFVPDKAAQAVRVVGAITGETTVPQLFVNGHKIGGLEAIERWARKAA